MINLKSLQLIQVKPGNKRTPRFVWVDRAHFDSETGRFPTVITGLVLVSGQFTKLNFTPRVSGTLNPPVPQS